jgi:predicted MFS family arabinose efflux permease
MESQKHASEATAPGILTAFGSMVGLAFGPSVIAILAFSPYIPPIQQEFGWSRFEVSFGSSIAAWMIVLVSPLQGILVDRFGPKRVVLTSIPLFALGIASLYFMPNNLGLFYLTWALIPILGIGLWPLGYLQAVTRWFNRKLGLALGCANAGIGLGTFMMPLIFGAFLTAFDWRVAFLGIAGLVLFVSWPAVFFCVREPSDSEIAARALGTQRSAFGLPFNEAKRKPAFLILCATFFMLGLTATSLVIQQVPLLMDAGWAEADARWIGAFYFGIALLVARVTVGFIIDHIFAPIVMMTVAVGGAISCVLYAVNPDMAIVSATLLGFLLGAEFDVLAFLIKRYFGNVAYGRLYGVIFGVFYLGSGVGIAALSRSYETFGNYDIGLYIAAGVLVSSALLLVFLPQYRYKVGAEAAAEPATA